MIWLGPVRHHGDWIKVVSTQYSAGFRSEREDRVLNVRRGEYVGVHEDVLNVFHFRDNDMAYLLRVEHRVFLAKRRGDRVWISQVFIAQRRP